MSFIKIKKKSITKISLNLQPKTNIIKKHIPNLITLLNLFSGLIAVIFAVKDDLVLAAFFVVLGIFFDYFDGFFARILDVQGELGKQLDSLADMVTSGVVPGIVLFKLLEKSNTLEYWSDLLSFKLASWIPVSEHKIQMLPYFGLIITLAAAYRLANFNIDERQSSSFIGLPTPAMTLFVISLPLILQYSTSLFAINLTQNTYFLMAITLVGSWIMNAEIPLFSLKFKTFGFKENVLTYSFLLISILLIVLLKFVAIPLIIVIYVLTSIIQNFKNKTNHKK